MNSLNLQGLIKNRIIKKCSLKKKNALQIYGPCLDLYKEVFNDISIDKILDKQHNDVFATNAKGTHKGFCFRIQ